VSAPAYKPRGDAGGQCAAHAARPAVSRPTLSTEAGRAAFDERDTTHTGRATLVAWWNFLLCPPVCLASKISNQPMNINRRAFSAQVVGTGAGLSALALMLTTPARAQGGEPVEGKDFTLVNPPVAPATSPKIEVLEFFSYGCPHCSAFEPTLEAWAQKLPADVVFKRVPVPFLMNAENFQRSYFALDSLGLVGTMQRKLFTAVHVDHLRLEKPAEIGALVAKNGGDEKKFLDAFNSFSVATHVSRAKKLTADFKIDGVPTIAIHGRFLTSPSLAGSSERALAVADVLIQRARKG
jgi:protein dithiol oxidoreductase (disulfide-forming)